MIDFIEGNQNVQDANPRCLIAMSACDFLESKNFEVCDNITMKQYDNFVKKKLTIDEHKSFKDLIKKNKQVGTDVQKVLAAPKYIGRILVHKKVIPGDIDLGQRGKQSMTSIIHKMFAILMIKGKKWRLNDQNVSFCIKLMKTSIHNAVTACIRPTTTLLDNLDNTHFDYGDIYNRPVVFTTKRRKQMDCKSISINASSQIKIIKSDILNDTTVALTAQFEDDKKFELRLQLKALDE